MADSDLKGELEDSPATIALGSLLKLTETHFWVDLYTGIPYDSTSLEGTETAKNEVICSSRTENCSLSVDTELSRQMNELGLPLSFCTNKEKQNGKVRGKRKNGHKKVLHTHEESCVNSIVDEMKKEDSLEHVDMHVDENRKYGLIEDDCETIENVRNDGDWMRYWDEFYGRNYYYNSTTQESTWDPPPHMMESVYVSSEMVSKMDDEVEADVCKEENSEKAKRKKKVKKTRAHRRSSVEKVELEVPDISKYWCQRYLLFSKYDEGIKMDEEGWFSATPECIANHHALRCGKGIIVDCFTGVGGNAIRFAPNAHTIAIDIDPNKIEYAQHNASVYGVEHLIEFITGDSFILAQNLKADTVFLSPPWGGPQYAKARNFDIITMLKPHNGQFLFNVAKQIAPRIVMFLPRNVDINQLADLSLSANPPWKLEVEKNFLNGKLKAITAYFTHPSLCDEIKTTMKT